MRAVMCLGAAALILVGCQQKPVSPPAPTQAAAETFKGCTWQEVTGKTLSIWSYACGPQSSNIHLVADETLPGFGLVSGNATDGMSYSPIIRTFAKDANASIDAVLPQIRKLSPGPSTASCTLQPAEDPLNPDYSGRKLYELAPTGEAKTKWDENVKTGGDGTPPCGELGVAFAGDRIFEIMPDDAARVVYIDYGSEIQIFDTTTLKAVKSN